MTTRRAPSAATAHPLATDAAVRALEAGGSAVDAAVAAHAVLAVAAPHMTGLGGDAVWLVAPPGERVRALLGIGPAAAAATPAFYAEHGVTERPPARGPLAALTVPGGVDAWRVAHAEYGRLPWTRLLADATRHAREGVVASASFARWLENTVPHLAGTARATFAPDGAPVRERDAFQQLQLAGTLAELARDGARAFYEGPLARALSVPDSPLAPEDFAGFEAEWVDPVTTRYRGVDVVQAPPPTQGVTALAVLNALAALDAASWTDGGPAHVRAVVGAVRDAFAVRDACLADPRVVDVPVDRLARGDAAPGGGRGNPRVGGGGDTSAASFVDADGLVVSTLQSLYHEFGAGVAGGNSGVLLQNRGTAFTLAPGHPNRLAPGKRPAHTLIPALVMRDGAPWVSFGSMGGDGQPQTHAMLVTRLVDFGLPLADALAAPRWLWGRTWGARSSALWLESRVPLETIHALRGEGLPAFVAGPFDERMGHAQAVMLHADGRTEAAADPRGDGSARVLA